MASVTGFTAERMLEIENSTVVDGEVDGSGHLILEQRDGTQIDAGSVKGPKGDAGTAASMPYVGPTPPASPVVGQLWYDTSNLTGLTDLLASKNPITSTANWAAASLGYDTGVAFSIAGGGCTHTYSTAGNHLGGINTTGLTAGQSYLALARVQVPAGSPSPNIAAAFKSSGLKTNVKALDVTLQLSFIADGASAIFGIECGGATGSLVVKQFSVYAVNQKGFPAFIWDGTSWVLTVDISAKGDLYSRVNTYGDQTVAGIKNFTGDVQVNGISLVPAAGAHVPYDTFASFALAITPGLHKITAAAADGPMASTVFMCETTFWQPGSALYLQQEAWIQNDGLSTSPDSRRWMRQMYGVAGNTWGPWQRVDAAWFNQLYFSKVRRLTDQAIAVSGIYQVIFTELIVQQAPALAFNWDAGGIIIPQDGLYHASAHSEIIPDTAGGRFYSRITLNGGAGVPGLDLRGTVGGTNVANPSAPYQCVAGDKLGMNVIAYTQSIDLTQATLSVYGPIGVGPMGPQGPAGGALVTTPWTGLTLQGTWEAYGGGYQVPQYRKVGDEVQLRGLVRLGAAGSVITNLPAGFRPPGDHIFACADSAPVAWNTGAASTGTAHSHTASGPSNVGLRVTLSASGDLVIPAGTGTGYLDLCQIRFSITP